MSIFGLTDEGTSGGGDFLPIVKFDARAGRMFRVDRTEGANGWENVPTDITRNFKAVVDLENLETGYIDFNTGGAPAMALAQIGDPLPPKPTPNAKRGGRFMLKLSKEVGGDKPIREMSGVAKVFLAGVEELHNAYKAEAAANPGKLPVVILEDTVPVKSGSGDKQSTNYRPVFKITGWVPRGDLVFQPKGAAAPATTIAGANAAAESDARQAPPSTGSTRVEAPTKAAQPEIADANDFG